MKKTILITGAAGFIGSHLWELLSNTYNLVLLDNLATFSNYNIKLNRLQNKGLDISNIQLGDVIAIENHSFYFEDINNKQILTSILQKHQVEYVIHLAAATGVRKSITHPEIYTASNTLGFNTLLSVCHTQGVKNIIYASSSSVYGDDTPVPFSEDAPCNNPLSYYAVTKKNNELTAHSYAANYHMNLIGLRFFTVYGPWSRPDMANYKFMNAIANNSEITLFNNGLFKRDFTYVSDIVFSIQLLLNKMIEGNYYKNEIFNIGNSSPVLVQNYLALIEKEMKTKATIVNQKADKEEMDITFSNSDKLFNEINYKPTVSIEEGIKNSVAWFLKYKETYL